MAKNYVDETDMEHKSEKEIKDTYEKGRTGYNDGDRPLTNNHEQQFPGDEIVEDLRELSRQDDDPAFTQGENVQQDPRYGDSISETADDKLRQREEDPEKMQNDRNYQNSGNGRNSE
jgi:hypothetical protein